MKTIGLHHPLDGITNPEYKLLHFIQVTLFCKNKRALAFNRDRCCHLALCLQLTLFHCNIARLFCARILPPSCLGHLRWHDTDRIISVSVVLPKLGRASRGQNCWTVLACEFVEIFVKNFEKVYRVVYTLAMFLVKTFAISQGYSVPQFCPLLVLAILSGMTKTGSYLLVWGCPS